MIHNIRFLYQRSPRGAFLLFFLIIFGGVLEFLTFSSMVPLVWDQESVLKDITSNIFSFLGVKHSIGTVIVFVAVTYILRNVVVTLRGIASAKITTKIRIDIKTNLVDLISKADYLYVSKQDAGVINNVIIKEADSVVLSMISIIGATSYILFSLVMLIIALLLEPLLIIVVASIMFPLYYGMKKLITMSEKISDQRVSNSGRIQSIAMQILSSFKYLKNTGSGDKITAIASGHIHTQGSILLTQQIVSNIARNGTDLILILVVLGCLFVYTGPLGKSVVGVIFILFAFRRSMLYLNDGQSMFQQYLELSGSVKIVEKTTAELKHHTTVIGTGTAAPNFDEPIRMDNISFEYTDGIIVLDQMNLEIPPGKMTAIVGASGSGKSTMTMLITGVLTPLSGRMTIGDTPYDDLDLAQFRSQIGYVAQENVIFNDTIENNITLWDDKPDWDRIRQAITISMVDEFLDELPEGLDSIVGNDGNSLSGGQRQRITIAREIYKNGKILILDEATSALDSEIALSVLKNIREHMKDITVVLITHRMEAADLADQVYKF